MNNLVSFLVSSHNNERSVAADVNRILDIALPDGIEREMILVDDGSNDGTPALVRALEQRWHGVVRTSFHTKRLGRGAAVRTALGMARGFVSIIPRAGVQYGPHDLECLVSPLLAGRADAVLGSRYARRFSEPLTAFRTELLRTVPLRSRGSSLEWELLGKLARRKARMEEFETSDSTYPKPGFVARLRALAGLRFAFSRDINTDSGPEALTAMSHAPRFHAWMADAIRPFVGNHVLEVGAGIGNMTIALMNGKARWVTADVFPEHLDCLRQRFGDQPNVEVRYCDLMRNETFSELHDQMDCIVCLNVLEHVEDDVTALRNMYASLTEGGVAIVLVPHDQALFGTLDRALGHCRRYSEEQLRSSVLQAGFEVDRILAFNRISRPAWYLSARVFNRRVVGTLQMRIFDHLVWMMRKLDNRWPWPPLSIIAIARKPCAPQAGRTEPEGNMLVRTQA